MGIKIELILNSNNQEEVKDKIFNTSDKKSDTVVDGHDSA